MYCFADCPIFVSAPCLCREWAIFQTTSDKCSPYWVDMSRLGLYLQSVLSHHRSEIGALFCVRSMSLKQISLISINFTQMITVLRRHITRLSNFYVWLISLIWNNFTQSSTVLSLSPSRSHLLVNGQKWVQCVISAPYLLSWMACFQNNLTKGAYYVLQTHLVLFHIFCYKFICIIIYMYM